MAGDGIRVKAAGALVICYLANVAYDPACEPAYRCMQPPSADNPIPPHEEGRLGPHRLIYAEATSLSSTAHIAKILL